MSSNDTLRPVFIERMTDSVALARDEGATDAEIVEALRAAGLPVMLDTGEARATFTEWMDWAYGPPNNRIAGWIRETPELRALLDTLRKRFTPERGPGGWGVMFGEEDREPTFRAVAQWLATEPQPWAQQVEAENAAMTDRQRAQVAKAQAIADNYSATMKAATEAVRQGRDPLTGIAVWRRGEPSTPAPSFHDSPSTVTITGGPGRGSTFALSGEQSEKLFAGARYIPLDLSAEPPEHRPTWTATGFTFDGDPVTAERTPAADLRRSMEALGPTEPGPDGLYQWSGVATLADGEE